MSLRFQRLLFLSIFLLTFTACDQLDGAGVDQPPLGGGVDEDTAAPTGDFGVSEFFSGPFLNDADSSITDASDERVVSVEAGGKVYVQIDYEDPSGISAIEVNLVNSNPEGLAGALDPSQRFFTLGQPTDISEPSTCDLSDSPTSVRCIYEIRVAEDAVNITELENSADEFAYVFRTKVTDAAGNTSDEAERGYVTIAGEEGDGEGDNGNSTVNVLDPVLERLIRTEISKPEGDLTKQDLEKVEVVDADAVLNPGGSVQDLEGLQFAINLTELQLPFTRVSDLSPLLDNPGLGEGDLINLVENVGGLETCPGSDDREDIDALIERGVEVLFDEPENCDTDDDNSQTVEIPDEGLREVLRGELGLGEDAAITREDLASLTSFNYNSGDGLGPIIESVEGLQFATNLTNLRLAGNFIEDFSPLTGLTNLESLAIQEDVISSLAFLSNLTNLVQLDLFQSSIADDDFEPLRKLINLNTLDLSFTGIDDLSPLVANEGLGEGDSVVLEENNLETCPGTDDRQNIDTLIERGVEVFFDESENCDSDDSNEGDAFIRVTTTSGAASLDNECTLRAAITAANTDSAVGGCPAGDGEDTVALDNGATYTLSEVDNAREDESGFSFANGLPVITSRITLEGNGATVERHGEGPTFRILEVAQGGDLNLERVTLQGGSGDFIGSGIYNAGRAFVSLSVVRANGSAEIPGGGIYNTGNFILDGSDVVENAGVEGAGVYNTGMFTAFESSIDNNEGVNSGGVTNEGVMILEQSSISGNLTDDSRGAMLNTETGVFTARSARISSNGDDGITFENQGEAHFENVVYSGNGRELWNGGTMTITKSAIVRSGGIENFGTLTVTNSTLSNLGRTLKDFNASVLNRDGGTLSLSYSTIAGNESSLVNEAGTFTLTSSILADNAESEDEQEPNCVGPITSGGYNIDSDGSCNLNQTTDLSNVDPQLGALQDNGGPTPTHALQADSPAVDTISTDACEVSADQRGVSRPQGKACDIGAFELE